METGDPKLRVFGISGALRLEGLCRRNGNENGTYYLGLCRDNWKERHKWNLLLGLCRNNGKENGNYDLGLGFTGLGFRAKP